jgi:D-aspartate ligase
MTTNSNIQTSKPPVILIGGNVNALSIARCLGPKGIEVYDLDGEEWLRRSRYVQQIDLSEARSHNPSSRLDCWMQWLLGDSGIPFAGAILISCTDEAVEMVACNRAALAERFVLDESADDVNLALLDKVRTYEIAAEIGVSCPRNWQLEGSENLDSICAELSYPCALKPRHSHVFVKTLKLKMIVVRDEEELRSEIARMESLGLQILITEIIPGEDDQYFSYWTYVEPGGEPQFDYMKRKYRQNPVHFGLGTFHKSVNDEEVREIGRRFVLGSRVRGIAVVEFKRDSRDNKLKLMECNVRFTKANDILVRSGINLPLLVYNRLTGNPLPPCDSFRAGVGLWFPREDFWAFRQYHRLGELTVWQWIRSLIGLNYTPVFSFRDPGPSFALLKDILKQWAARIKGSFKS